MKNVYNKNNNKNRAGISENRNNLEISVVENFTDCFCFVL